MRKVRQAKSNVEMSICRPKASTETWKGSQFHAFLGTHYSHFPLKGQDGFTPLARRPNTEKIISLRSEKVRLESEDLKQFVQIISTPFVGVLHVCIHIISSEAIVIDNKNAKQDLGSMR